MIFCQFYVCQLVRCQEIWELPYRLNFSDLGMFLLIWIPLKTKVRPWYSIKNTHLYIYRITWPNIVLGDVAWLKSNSNVKSLIYRKQTVTTLRQNGQLVHHSSRPGPYTLLQPQLWVLTVQLFILQVQQHMPCKKQSHHPMIARVHLLFWSQAQGYVLCIFQEWTFI